ncbi:hypothetical protein [Bradyrhizobium elkanii]|uniref:hypothetical protein n=1 Tax=Bradyrhizobium elkanii TaxID=29448 RepID=UPI001448C13B|nr:hypothetical protein [Bradyrhizobium elkanii]MCS3576544.1 hypothetical protein [Bradyrhizobium elkanii]MCS3719433.1 hypothetical protein [Bradyrhizobium elkanii]MCS4003838.1 hypothetical protein [Bradyrhizobium elkanii USDA 61]BBB99001.1 hypothetical protein BE61_44420 [Bradyrhizobium elkanii USDA 61]
MVAFQKGVAPKYSRQKGVLNKVTRDIKNGIIEGAIQHGYDGKGKGGLDGYLRMCATKYPKQYMRLLARVLPYTITAEIESRALIASINVIPIPADLFLTAAPVIDNVVSIKEGSYDT